MQMSSLSYGFRVKLNKRCIQKVELSYFSSSFNAVFYKMIIIIGYWWTIIAILFLNGVQYEILHIWKVSRIFIFHPILMKYFSLCWLRWESMEIFQQMSSISFSFVGKLNRKGITKDTFQKLNFLIFHENCNAFYFLQNDNLHGLLMGY